MLDWLRSLWAPRAARQTLRARYDAAQTDRHNVRHWAAADGLSAAAANSPEVRQRLRMRARYERANNAYCAGIVQTLAHDTIGRGPRLQLQTPDRGQSAQVERQFQSWAQAIHLAEKLRVAREAKAVDGEAFLLLVTNPRLPHPVQLDVRLVEADQIATPTLLGTEPQAVDGIRFDAAGNPVEYHLLREHPGDVHYRGGWGQYDPLPADQVLHLFRRARPGQVRGVPEITPALPLFAQLRRYTLATLSAAEQAANVSSVLETNSAASTTDDLDPLDVIETDRNTLLTLPRGWKATQIKAEQPTATYREFKSELLNEIARCLDMPFNKAAGNSASYNYASGRLDHQTYFKSISVEQSYFEAQALAPLLAAWLAEATLVGLIPAGLGPYGDWGVAWFWDGTEHVDPLKEANAQRERLRSHTTTLALEYARQGLDWEEQLQQRARELARMRELNLPLDTTRAAPDDEKDPDEHDAETQTPSRA